MILEGSNNLPKKKKWMKNIRNGNYMTKYRSFFCCYIIYDWLHQQKYGQCNVDFTKQVTLICGTTAQTLGKKKCKYTIVRFLCYRWSDISLERLWQVKEVQCRR